MLYYCLQLLICIRCHVARILCVCASFVYVHPLCMCILCVCASFVYVSCCEMFRYGLCVYIDISYSERLVTPVVGACVGVSD